jgi:hypothetical protein
MLRRGCLCLQLLDRPRGLSRSRCSSAVEPHEILAAFSKQLPRRREWGRPDRPTITQPAAAAAAVVTIQNPNGGHA